MEKSRLEEYANKTGSHSNWDAEELSGYGHKLYETIKRNGLLPKNMDGFVFLSVSANAGTKEREFAKSLQEDLKEKNFDKKPIIISADMAWVKNSGKKEDENYVLADARKIPLTDESVDMIFDRMGATWYATLEADSDHLADLLKEMLRALKKHGKILVDAGATNKLSTSERIMKILNVRDLDALNLKLKDFGLHGTYAGEERNRILVLEKID